MIEIRHLTKQFGRVFAVSDISLTIRDHQIFGLLGTNGAGKTTMMRMIAGIMHPDGGEILIDELKIVNKKLKANNEKNNKKDSQHYIELIKTHKRWKNEQQHLSIIQSQLNRAMNNNGSNPMNFTNHFGNAGYGNFNNVFNSYRRGDSDDEINNLLTRAENVNEQAAQVLERYNNHNQRYGVQNSA